MIVKYKVSEVARDLNVDSKEIINLLLKYESEPKKTTSTLSEEELNLIFQHYTTVKALSSFDSYFEEGNRHQRVTASQKEAKKEEPKKAEVKKEEPKKEVKKEVKAETKKEAPKKE